MPMDFYPVGGGTSSLELSRTSKGEYTWGVKLYFVGHDMRTIKQMINNVNKTRIILEVTLGQRIAATEDTKRFIEELEAEALKVQKQAEAKKKAKQEGQ